MVCAKQEPRRRCGFRSKGRDGGTVEGFEGGAAPMVVMNIEVCVCGVCVCVCWEGSDTKLIILMERRGVMESSYLDQSWS